MVHKWEVTIPKLTGDTPRRAYIYLPESYHTKANRRYPVMYMFDGHNVFFDSDATYGKSWGMARYMDSSRKQLIIVGIECNHEGTGRLQEYSPVTFSNHLGDIKGRGRTYMEWLTRTLKPYIDENYRTLPDRRHTLIAGSSMGGLMALYGATVYNHVFQRAACLSPSIWVNPERVLQLVDRAKVRSDTCIYLDYGSKEMTNHEGNLDILMDTVALLLGKQVDLTFRIVPGGSHTEASWEKQIPIFMNCLGV